jgi:ABC-2 type transport system permease protein
VWFLLLVGGGIAVPLDRMPDGLAAIGAALPSGALAEALRATLGSGEAPGIGPVLVLLGWAIAAGAVAAKAVRLR